MAFYQGARIKVVRMNNPLLLLLALPVILIGLGLVAALMFGGLVLTPFLSRWRLGSSKGAAAETLEAATELQRAPRPAGRAPAIEAEFHHVSQ